MKKYLFIASMMLATVCAQAQLRVYENGSVAIGTTATPVGGFTIGYAGHSQFNNSITGNNGGLYVRRTGTPTISFNWWKAIEASTTPIVGNFNIGVRGNVTPSTEQNGGRAYGVWGEASNTASGYNYGVFGRLLGTRNGAAIYGTTYGDNGENTNGRYAGFFQGDVRVTGTLQVANLTTMAASSNNATVLTTLNTNSTNASVADKLAQLSTIQFNINPPVATTSTLSRGDTIDTPIYTDTELQAMQKSHYGLVAAQLQQIYPDLVYENQHGELCINYIEMIPLLVQSINELNARIANQGSGAVVMSRAIGGATDIEEATALTIPVLKQNNPNPFTENTVIEYSLPETVETANIYIYDMNGKQIQQIVLNERGNSSVTISGGELNAGMYLYSLIADGQVIDTKRMILTK